jgi:hypothetical protein
VAVASRYSSVDNSVVPTKDAVFGRGGSKSRAVRPLVSIVVVMNTSNVSG